MFTGLIETIGRVTTASGGEHDLRIATSIAGDLTPGESIAVNGVCLTVARVDTHGFEVNVAPETRRVTTLDRLRDGHRVNLERSLKADARLGGHFVLGHVDARGSVASVTAEGDCLRVEFDLPDMLAPLVILKGSIAIDGVSLTIASLDRVRVAVQLVPFTMSHTTLGGLAAGDAVNVEVDVLGKYVARLLESRVALSGPTPAFQ